ncbi:MAG: hypothetical protein Q9160_001089 [Pyrenula sp. 1 TL-2023]
MQQTSLIHHTAQQQSPSHIHSSHSQPYPVAAPMDDIKLNNFVKHLRQKYAPTMNTVKPGYQLETYFDLSKQQQFNPDSLRHALDIIACQNVDFELKCAMSEIMRKDQELRNAMYCNSQLTRQLEEASREIADLRNALNYYHQAPGSDHKSKRILSAPPRVTQPQTPIARESLVSPLDISIATRVFTPSTVRFGSLDESKASTDKDNVHQQKESYGFGHAETTGPVFSYDTPKTSHASASPGRHDAFNPFLPLMPLTHEPKLKTEDILALPSLTMPQDFRTATTPEITNVKPTPTVGDIPVKLPFSKTAAVEENKMGEPRQATLTATPAAPEPKPTKIIPPPTPSPPHRPNKSKHLALSSPLPSAPSSIPPTPPPSTTATPPNATPSPSTAIGSKSISTPTQTPTTKPPSPPSTTTTTTTPPTPTPRPKATKPTSTRSNPSTPPPPPPAPKILPVHQPDLSLAQ